MSISKVINAEAKRVTKEGRREGRSAEEGEADAEAHSEFEVLGEAAKSRKTTKMPLLF